MTKGKKNPQWQKVTSYGNFFEKRIVMEIDITDLETKGYKQAEYHGYNFRLQNDPWKATNK